MLPFRPSANQVASVLRTNGTAMFESLMRLEAETTMRRDALYHRPDGQLFAISKKTSFLSRDQYEELKDGSRDRHRYIRPSFQWSPKNGRPVPCWNYVNYCPDLVTLTWTPELPLFDAKGFMRPELAELVWAVADGAFFPVPPSAPLAVDVCSGVGTVIMVASGGAQAAPDVLGLRSVTVVDSRVRPETLDGWMRVRDEDLLDSFLEAAPGGLTTFLAVDPRRLARSADPTLVALALGRGHRFTAGEFCQAEATPGLEALLGLLAASCDPDERRRALSRPGTADGTQALLDSAGAPVHPRALHASRLAHADPARLVAPQPEAPAPTILSWSEAAAKAQESRARRLERKKAHEEARKAARKAASGQA